MRAVRTVHHKRVAPSALLASDHIERLRGVLGEHVDEMLPQFTHICRRYRYHWRPLGEPATRKAAQKLLKAAERFLATWAQLPIVARRELHPLFRHPEIPNDVGVFVRDARVSWLLRSKEGRPREYARAMLVWEVADALTEWADERKVDTIRPTKARTGVLARVSRILLAAVGEVGASQLDLFAEINQAVNLVRVPAPNRAHPRLASQ